MAFRNSSVTDSFATIPTPVERHTINFYCHLTMSAVSRSMSPDNGCELVILGGWRHASPFGDGGPVCRSGERRRRFARPNAVLTGRLNSAGPGQESEFGQVSAGRATNRRPNEFWPSGGSGPDRQPDSGSAVSGSRIPVASAWSRVRDYFVTSFYLPHRERERERVSYKRNGGV